MIRSCSDFVNTVSIAFWIAIAAIFLLIIFAIAIPCNVSAVPKAQEVETKANLHNIRIAIERYRIDQGEYPLILLGGDKEGWDYYNANRPKDQPYLTDPLIASGYLESYPENAFTMGWGLRVDKKTLKWFKEAIKGPDGKSFDPRFGLNGDKMGNVLTEPYVFVEPFGDWPEGYPRLCPGQFFYKALGDIESVVALEDLNIQSPDDYEYDSYTHYFLGAFGSLKTPGEDVIRWTDLSGNIPEKFPYVSETDNYEKPDGLNIDVNLRLPEVFGDGDPSQRKPPTWPPWQEGSMEGAYRAPDGYKDGVIYTLKDHYDLYNFLDKPEAQPSPSETNQTKDDK